MQASGDGGLVGISYGTGHVSVVGSTLSDMAVRAHCRVPAEYPRTAAPVRLLRTADAPTQCRKTCAVYPQYPAGVPPRCSVLTAHLGAAGYRWWALPRALRGLRYAD
jgi:hypothetical protein